MNPEYIVVNGIGYNVVSADTPETLDARGLHGVADFLREQGIARQLGLTRPRGNVTYIAREFVRNGHTSYQVVTKF